MKQPSKERGCSGKMKIRSRKPMKRAEQLAKKHGKQYGVYLCPHCDSHHLTTKIHNQGDYAKLVGVTSNL